MPNITGEIKYDVWARKPSGAFYSNGGVKRAGTEDASGSSGGTKGFSASLSNSIYGNSNTVTPLSESTIYIIKY